MTRKLYYEDVYQKEFDAEVTKCVGGPDGYHVYLDQSAFFPEGGGQSGDRGYLLVDAGEQSIAEDCLTTPSGTDTGLHTDPADKIRVKDTQEDGGDIYVVCDRSLAAGSRVHGVLDWEWRFDRMQNHSGEHIVSGIIHSLYGYQNVGFHMSLDRMTIDLSGEITEQELQKIEEKANEIVWSNAEIHTDVYTEEEAEKVDFRSKKELHGIIRVVTIPGADVCACCGTHVGRTGEIGPIRLISHEKFRGGIRIEMMCGRWAFTYMSGIIEQNRQVSALVSARPLKTAAGVRRVLERENDLKMELLSMRYREIDKAAKDLKDRGALLLFAKNYDSVLVQKLAAKVMETCNGPVFAMSGDEETGCHYAAGEKDGDLKETVKAMNVALGGKGGGRPYFLQGSLKAGRADIENYLKSVLEGISVIDM